MSRRFSKFLSSGWDKVTVKWQQKEEEGSSPSNGPSVLHVDDTKGNATYGQESSAKDTSTETTPSLIQDVSRGPPSKSKGL